MRHLMLLIKSVVKNNILVDIKTTHIAFVLVCFNETYNIKLENLNKKMESRHSFQTMII